ncbi:helix-turn-helix domain-containing protein [Chitinophaga sp.]|uniref:helix-turn-helix domain-containing protein n=1 Tax=Chitinophaga sp. TaxID=1869181 RepID=UPI002F9567DB
MRKPKILLHQNELMSIGVDIVPIKGLAQKVQTPHRDDHYMFIIQQKGMSAWELDFSAVTLNGASLCFITPGQVHRYLNNKNSEGWLVFADTALTAKPYREIFDTFLHNRQVVDIQKNADIFIMISVLEKLLRNEEMPLKKAVVSSLLDTVTGMIASEIVQFRHSTGGIGSQKYTIATKFRQLVKEQYKDYKLVKDYAALLNITPLYLNEVMKEISGFAASYWIHQEVILEAKRLLYYTGLDIKEIAFELGYEDHAYFSRFFKKNTGMTASLFRRKKP